MQFGTELDREDAWVQAAGSFQLDGAGVGFVGAVLRQRYQMEGVK